MNRYLTRGIFLDLIEGKSVVIVSESQREAEELFRAVVAEVVKIGEWDRVSYVNGAQGAWLGAASVRVHTMGYMISRFPHVDVVVLLTGMRSMDIYKRDALVASCAIANTELIATD